MGLGLVALTGCGFQPLYGPGGGADALRGQIAIEAPQTQDSYFVVRALEARLGRPEAETYRLSLDLEITERPAAFTPDRQITRFTLDGSARWRLFDAEGTLMASGEVESFTAYSATGTTAATLAGEADARRRLARILADLIATELLATAR